MAFQRIHIDFVGPYWNRMFVFILDSFTKWVEFVQMQNMTESEAIKHILMSSLDSRFRILLLEHSSPQTIFKNFVNVIASNI